MSYTYNIANAIGQVRFEIGDTTEATALFSDEEITYKLSEHGNGVLLTAAALCDVLATRYAGDYTFKTDDQQFNRSDLAKAYTARADALRTRAQNESNGGIAVVGFTRTDAHSSDISARDGEGSSAGRVRAGYSDPDLPD